MNIYTCMNLYKILNFKIWCKTMSSMKFGLVFNCKNRIDTKIFLHKKNLEREIFLQ